MKCTQCCKAVKRGVVDHGMVYCSQEHADKHWLEGAVDQWASNESDGLYSNYEDYMENVYGATIADDHCYPRREY